MQNLETIYYLDVYWNLKQYRVCLKTESLEFIHSSDLLIVVFLVIFFFDMIIKIKIISFKFISYHSVKHFQTIKC